MESQSWSVIIFCFNEAGTLSSVVAQTKQVLNSLAPSHHEIILVDDGSTDGSQEIAEKLARTIDKIRLILHPHNRGIGEALRSGYENSRYENVCAVPADGQFDVQELIRVGTFSDRSFVSFYRERNTIYGPLRKAISGFNRLWNRHMVGMTLQDVNWVKVYKRESLLRLNIELRSLLVESEICAKLTLLGFQPILVPSKYLQRKAGVAKGNSRKIVLQAVQDMIRLWLVVHKFKKTMKTVAE